MEFLKTCNTNVQSIGGFEAVSYQAFSVSRSTAPSDHKPHDLAPHDTLSSVEANLRQLQQLVVRDATRPWLWLFRATAVDQLSEEPAEPPDVEGYEFRREQYGVMKALELARPPMNRIPTPATPSSAGPSAPSTPVPPRASQTSGAPQQTHDCFSLYELFTSSIVALISYRFVKEHRAIGLNFRTFLSRPAPIDDDAALSETTRFIMTNLGVYWASNGTLLVSGSSAVQSAIHCLADLSTSESQTHLLGHCIRIAPNGVLAKVVSFEDPVDAAIELSDNRARRKRVKKGPIQLGIERWKAFLSRWLLWKGYSIPGIENKTSWVRISLSQPNQTASSGSPVSNLSRDVMWPRALCFFYDSPCAAGAYVESLIPSPDDALDWFATPHSRGFRDPIDAVQEWFLGKAERDAVIEARRQAKKAEEEAARNKEDNNVGMFPSSPVNSRTNVYGDLQAAGGMYPTPPDGVLPGTAVSHSDTPSISGTVANTVLVHEGSNPSINVLAPPADRRADGVNLAAASPEFTTRYDNFNPAGNNDDLFDEMEEDDFGGNGVTDADFNFFDEPEDDEVDMLDAPGADDGAVLAAMEARTDQGPSAIGTDGDSKRVPDSMTALENALAAASAAAIEEANNSDIDNSHRCPGALIKMEGASGTPLAPQFSSPMRLEGNRAESPLQHGSSPFVKDGSSVRIQGTTARHRDSVFEPVNFDRKMSLSDAKYYSGRFTFSDGKQKPANKALHLKAQSPVKLQPLSLLTGLNSTFSIPSKAAASPILSGDSESSDAVSEASSEDEETASVLQAPLSAGLSGTSKRKLPTDGNATPLSATSYAGSLAAEGLDIPRLSIDEGSLALFEPSPWDWSLTDVPAPAELPSRNGRYAVPAFSPGVVSLPGTPTSQPDLPVDQTEESSMSKNDCIAVVQVVTEQIVSATLDIFHESPSMTPLVSTPSLHTGLKDAVRDIFPKAEDCNVVGLVSVTDVYPELPAQPKGQQRPPPRKPNEGPVLPGSHILPMHAPFIRVRRSDTLWELLPPAVAFWESLGLAPCSVAKNVGAMCIYPHSNTLKPCLEHFLIGLRVAYEGLKLGSHDLVDVGPDFAQGLAPWAITTPTSTRAAFQSLREICKALGKALAAKHAEMREGDEAYRADAYVIYMINPFEDASAVWNLCSAFWTLFQAYGHGAPARMGAAPKPDLVLQIVPIQYIASFRVPVVLDGHVYANLAREVYDRCPPPVPSEDKSSLSIYAAPCFQLEESLPRRIDFKLQSDPPQDMLRDNSYMHIGYAISLDGNWVTAAWTDSCGKSRAVVSYNLGTRAFGEIAREIWQTTLDLCQARKVTWRICVAKCGFMEREEHEAWHFLATNLTQSVSFFVILLTLDPNPPLNFTPTMAGTTTQTNNTQGSAKTPVSTPQAGVSPDTPNLTPAATPAAEAAADPSNDPDARLVDVTDESWGIILAYRLHNTYSTVEFRPCLISGLLVKRGQPQQTAAAVPGVPDPEQGPIVVGVNILWVNVMNPNRAATSPFPTASDGVSPGGVQGLSPSPATERDRMSLIWTPSPNHRATAETLLKEILTQFRGLGTLAKLKGIRGTRMGTIPWHIAVARRGVEGLTRCYPTARS